MEKIDKILLAGFLLVVAGVIAAIYLTADTTPENPPLEEAIKFCQEEYNGTVKEAEYTRGVYKRYCVLPNGNECEINALYRGYCLHYQGKV